jgi:hypothetical protein
VKENFSSNLPPKADNSDLIETKPHPFIGTDTFTNIKEFIKPPKLHIKDCLTPSVVALNQNELRMFDRAAEASN